MENDIIILAKLIRAGFEVVEATNLEIDIPFYSTPISAGFPSPAEDYLEDKINLQELLIAHPSATYFLKVRGDSMRDANLHEGDLLVVDRSLKPRLNQVIIGLLDNEFTVKRLVKNQNQYYLHPENPAYPPILLPEESSRFQAWGVVTWCIHKVQ
ncbi:translesion error-prone DNA polymerase V autoproteolytic subunit [Adhaeribacter sp. BT258]|uniref:Translesion error-prone DNA polymerase V autoproteolytic subunit n=1 Tax=Adhaeribacter terrigena TaxID=2793070 RepID=A0ABS1C1W0_9BACT|nr:translesion error-prone DNA polymerase V autoproteolytic subunit [Adhaeribacter terrigena]MBK0402545.1 translesion error-prone DNA polymerase V autoproteolytic subunit [Adhaeribacter terrigena]